MGIRSRDHQATRAADSPITTVTERTGDVAVAVEVHGQGRGDIHRYAIPMTFLLIKFENTGRRMTPPRELQSDSLKKKG
jgi:hypothetical protein